MPKNVTLLGNRVVTDIIKIVRLLGWTAIQCFMSLQKEEIWVQRQTGIEGKQCEESQISKIIPFSAAFNVLLNLSIEFFVLVIIFFGSYLSSVLFFQTYGHFL